MSGKSAYNASNITTTGSDIVYRPYAGEKDIPAIMALVQSELSEPYVIYTYRYFLHEWPHLAFLACARKTTSSSGMEGELGGDTVSDEDVCGEPVGVIVCKQSMHRHIANRGYIAMLSVNKAWRNRGIASTLVRKSVAVMKTYNVDEVILETEYDNTAALSLYASLGFIREKRLYRFYLNGKDAFRLVLAVNNRPDQYEYNRRMGTIPSMAFRAYDDDDDSSEESSR